MDKLRFWERSLFRIEMRSQSNGKGWCAVQTYCENFSTRNACVCVMLTRIVSVSERRRVCEQNAETKILSSELYVQHRAREREREEKTNRIVHSLHSIRRVVDAVQLQSIQAKKASQSRIKGEMRAVIQFLYSNIHRHWAYKVMDEWKWSQLISVLSLHLYIRSLFCA